MPSLNQITVLKETVIPSSKVTVHQSLENSQSGVSLDNDRESPGANKVYGTDLNGAKGWIDATSVLSDIITTV